MTSAPHQEPITTIDVEPVREASSPPRQSTSSSALAISQGSFSTFLAPLTKDSFREVVSGVEDKLKVVNQTLGMLDSLLDSQGFDAILNEMLRSITEKTGELLNADRSTIFLLDEDKDELFTIVAKDEKGNALELRFPATVGIAGEVATEKKPVNIPYDFYNDPRSAAAQQFDKKNNYRTYTMLAMPLLNEETGNLVAVVQLLNKLKHDVDPHGRLEDKIDRQGFSSEDEQVFREFAPSIRLILESSKSFYAATQKQRAASALMAAVSSLSQASLDLEDTLKQVMDEAKKLMNADRSTLWLLDEEKDELWTKIPIGDKLQEIRIPQTAGFAGMVAESKKPLLIPFDLYDDPRSETSKKTDRQTGYRTCSMLCMPVFNSNGDLIGVTQLINKKKQGEHEPYDPENWPEAPEQWKSSFNRSDQEFMEAFNIQAGVALQNAKLFATVKQQQQQQKDILRSLSNGVISTDKRGNIIAVNESAMHLLGIDEGTSLDAIDLKKRVSLKEGKFADWFNAALMPKEEKDRQQYYPNQVLVMADGGEEQSINLSINSMADAEDPAKVNGALVVMEDISDEMEVKNLMYKYMTPEVAEALLATGDTGLGGKRKRVSVLFSDIRSYTTLTEKMQAEEVVAMLNAYFEEMVDAVFLYGGTLDKYIGDALMAVFGSPAPLEDDAWCAMQAAIAMRQRLAQFNEQRKAEGKMPISIGMGIHSDEVVSGNIGSSKRMELTSIGDGVNLASRLEGTSKQYGVDLVISEQTYRAYAEWLVVRELDFITVKGKTQPVTIYELVAIKNTAPKGKEELGRDISEAEQQTIDCYHKGREYYLTPAREKLSEAELLELLDRLAELSQEQIERISLNEKQMLQGMLGKLPLAQLTELLGENTLKRMLETEDLNDVAPSEASAKLPAQVSKLTPRLVKKMLVTKLKQFGGTPESKQMLEEEAKEMSVAQVKKLIELCKKPFVTKAKAAFKNAQTEFEKVLAIDPTNKAAKLHIDRCMLFAQQPPGEDWDGVWKLTNK
ncbi:MAG: GAF domain-containing protein [Cyanobacteriota bacterium]|nr:GAF domain-containing protein [Cyanobacteriota bacterium]